ncbi:unnamed protein product [Rhizophagus irregularis]|nr:unnamed protein product [Rhizophagus irregularis]
MTSTDIRVVVAIDFGTTYSGFAYANKINPEEIETNTRWSGREGLPKTNTALLYDANCDQVLRWGELALFQEQRRKKNQDAEQFHIIERFKLHLDNKMKQKPQLPIMFDYKKAITDYLIKMKGVIEESLERRWPGLSLKQVLFVLSVPAEWLPYTRAVLRECVFRAGFIDEDTHSNLEFITEPEAAAIHCLSVCNEHDLEENDTFLVVDCGGVGGFSESPYLTRRIKESFEDRVQTIAFPRNPIAAIVKGAVSYGLNMQVIESRIIPWTFGIEVKGHFDENNDPIRLRTHDGRIWRFDILVSKGESLKLNEERGKEYKPFQDKQEAIVFKVLYSKIKYPRYPSQNNVEVLGELRILLPDIHLGKNRPIEFSLKFAKEEIKASARNKITDKIYQTTFKYPFEQK